MKDPDGWISNVLVIYIIYGLAYLRTISAFAYWWLLLVGNHDT